MNKNDIITLKITDINNLGYGVGHIEEGTDAGKTVFVNGAVSGDKIRAKIIKVNTSFFVARLEEILEISPWREENKKSLCPAPLTCGGCVYRNISYFYELELKRNYVENAFKKAGLKDIEILPVLITGNLENYRNKAQYPVTNTKWGVTAGFYAAKTHKIIPINNCNIQHMSFQRIIDSVCRFATENTISVYDESTHTGILRHIYLRVGEATGQIMLCLVINADRLPNADNFVSNITTYHPEIKSILLSFNNRKTNVTESLRIVVWRAYIEDVFKR